MRDALIFLNEMLDEVRTFEAAATGNSYTNALPSPRKVSSRGREMIDSLNEPLLKLVNWLRLNDKDLLEQTSASIVRLLDRFARSKIPLHTEVVKRLRRLAGKYNESKSRKEQLLKPEQIMAILAALSKHPDHAEEFSETNVSGRKVIRKDTRNGVLSDQSKHEDRLKAPKHSASSRTSPISLDGASDASDDNSVQVVSSSTGVEKPSANYRNLTGKIPLKTKQAVPSKSALPTSSNNSGTKALPSNAKSSGPTFKIAKSVPSNPSTKYRTAPTKMKNAIYSHSAMRAARERSSDDESESDPGRPSGLARLAGYRPTAVEPQTGVAKQQEQRKTKMLELQHAEGASSRKGQRIMTALEMQTQDQNKARMRYNPDYSDLHRQILQWDVNHQGHTPHPGFKYPRTIPTTFENVGHYIDTFLPLLLLECWDEIASARDEINNGTSETEPITGKMAGRASTDDFVEIFFSVDRLTERQPLNESDLVLIKGACQTLGKVHQINRKQQKVDISIRIHLGRDDGAISRNLVNGTPWTIFKLLPSVAAL